MKTAIILCLLAAFAINAQTPIPARPPGYAYLNSSSAKVVIEAFYDHLCDDSKANWPTLKQLHTYYSNSKEVAIIIHIFPLPYHHNAYFVQQAGVVVRMLHSDCFVTYLDAMFASQEEFLSGAENLTEPEVKAGIAKFSETHCDIPTSRTMDGFEDPVIVRKSRYAWKYAAFRGITGTAQFIVNGVIDPNGEGYSIEEWQKMIQSLLNEK